MLSLGVPLKNIGVMPLQLRSARAVIAVRIRKVCTFPALNSTSEGVTLIIYDHDRNVNKAAVKIGDEPLRVGIAF
jgi:hypothetical protein